MPSRTTNDTKSKALAISNAIGALHREHYGRGADRIRTIVHGDFVVTTLEDCFTSVEKKMIAEGAFGQVRATRILFQDWMQAPFTAAVEESTGRKVRAFFSQVSPRPEIAVEMFLLEPEAGDGRIAPPPVIQ